jgi:hypothetical protein
MLVQRDPRDCAPPLCGLVVHELNRTTQASVSALTLAVADDQLRALVDDAPTGELIVHGHLAAGAAGRAPVVVVSEAYRGMPGMSADAAGGFLSVTAGDCTANDCLRPAVRWLNLTEAETVQTVSVARAAAAWVDAGWLRDRVLAHGAIALGDVSDDTLDARQVFLRLPDAVGPCATVSASSCADGMVPTFDRNDNRCLVPSGCSRPGICAMFLPVCAPGYTLRTWTKGSPACPAYACDPSFVAAE